jgi:hypothetical protein
MQSSNADLDTTFGCFVVALILVGLFAGISGTIFLSDLPTVPGNPDRERNLARLFATATAEVEAAIQNAQPVCAGQVMSPGDSCTVYVGNNIDHTESYGDRLRAARESAEVDVKFAVAQRLWVATYGTVLVLILSLILTLVFILLLIGAIKNRKGKRHLGGS